MGRQSSTKPASSPTARTAWLKRGPRGSIGFGAVMSHSLNPTCKVAIPMHVLVIPLGTPKAAELARRLATATAKANASAKAKAKVVLVADESTAEEAGRL